VQKKGLVILNFLDDIDKHRSNVADLKRAYLSSGLADPKLLFPDEFREKSPPTTEIPVGDNVTYDYSEVEWKSGSDAYAEYERLMKEINSATKGVLSGDLLTAQPQWTEWT
jgi:hypothetical protein